MVTQAPTSAPPTPLERERRAHGLSRERLGALAGISSRAIFRIEHGECRPHPATQAVLSSTLGVPVDALFPSSTSESPAADGALAKSAGGAAGHARAYN